MKAYRIAHLSVLIAGFAFLSPGVLAQAAPAAELPSRPAPDSAYTRPTGAEKLHRFTVDAVGPLAFAHAALGAGIQQATSSPPEWGGGAHGFGARLASNYGIGLVATTTRFGMAQVLHEDTAYYPCRCSGFFPRLGHSLISTFTARRGDDGHTSLSLSGLVSPYAGTMTALAWYPDRYGVKDGFRMGNYNLAGQAARNVVREFIYGGPHALWGSSRHPRSPGFEAAAQNP